MVKILHKIGVYDNKILQTLHLVLESVP